jgi:hypothetical protein
MAPSGFQLTAFSLVLSNPTELNARGDAEGGGGFSARHPAHVPNSSPSHVRFKESTPISQSCDLFSEGPRKRHPHALGLDELI